jgi:hypothetical protein
VFSLFGDAAPDLWLLVARAGGIAAVLLAFVLARRLAVGVRPALRIVAGVVAAAAIVLLPEWLKLMAQGSSEPLVIALIFGAVLRHLDGHPKQALALGSLVALGRPEAWPLVAVYAFVQVRRNPALLGPAAAMVVAVPLLWIVPDWIGSGDPLYGARRARARSAGGSDLSGGTTHRALEAAADLVLLPVLAAAVWATAVAWRARDWVTVALAAVSFPWVGGIILLAAAGYAGNSRYMLPAAAVLSVLAGVGVAQALESVPARVPRYALAALLVAVAVPFAIPRVRDAGDQADRVRLEGRLADDLPKAIDVAGGRKALLAMGAPVVNGWPAAPGMDRPVAWRLNVPLADVDLLRGGGARSLRHVQGRVVLFSPLHRAPSRSGAGLQVHVLARTAEWDVAAITRARPASPASGN